MFSTGFASFGVLLVFPLSDHYHTRIRDWLLQSCFLDLFISFVLQWLSLNWEVTGILLSQFPLTFLSNSKGAFPFHHTAFGYSLTDWDGPKAGQKLHLSPWFSAACGVAIAHRSQSLLSFFPTA